MNFRRKIDEVKYLTVENSERYRAIMKCMFDSFNEMRYWCYKEEILDVLNSYDDFEEYSMDQLKSDLASLLEWKNLIADADTKNTKTILEFKNREFKYQISKNSVEIEKMLVVLENLNVESEAHLNSTFMIKFTQILREYKKVKEGSEKEIYEWWNELKLSFKTLSSNYTNFISQFSSEKIEEILKIEEFLIFKEKFLKYLNDFIKDMQLNHSDISSVLRDEIMVEQNDFLEIVYEYEMSIPGIKKADKIEYMKVNSERLKGMINWFVESHGKDPLIKSLFDHTNEIINKIIKYAMKIYEDRSISYRRDEYLYIIEKFKNCKNIKEAHILSTEILGIEGTIHIKGIEDRETENTNSSVYEEKPMRLLLTEGRRGAMNTLVKNPLKMNTEAKLEKIKIKLAQREKEKSRLIELSENYTLELKKLPILSPEERKMILKYLSRKNTLSNDKVILKSTDGDLQLPDFKIEVK
ncbi:MAG: TIGR02677 family protein [Fusobacteriaceae bacterium]